MITLETFSEENRDRRIGYSQYRICKQNESPYLWYIRESYNEYPNGNTWAIGRGYFSDSLQYVIDAINNFTKERQVIDRAQ